MTTKSNWTSSARRILGVACALAVALAGGLAPITSEKAHAVGESFGATATAFRLDGESDADNVKLRWSTTEGAASYKVLRNPGAGAQVLATVPGNSYDDYDVGLGSFSYSVQAVGADGSVLGTSAVASAKTYSPPGGLKTFDNRTPSTLSRPSSIKVGSTYYAYGTTSTSNGPALTEGSSVDGYNFSGWRTVVSASNVCGSANAGLSNCKLESMKTVLNPATGKVSIVVHFENGTDYSMARLAIVQGTPGGSYSMTYNDRPLGNDSRDSSVYTENGDGFVISATNGNKDMNIYKLNPDWSGIESLVTTVLVGEKREAPSLVKHNGYYYLFTSTAAGWYPSRSEYISSTQIAGPWNKSRTIGNITTFGAQSGSVVKLGEQYAMMANRWSANWAHPEPKNTSRMLPITFNEGHASFDFYQTIDYNAETGTVVPVQHGRILSVGKPASATNVSSDSPTDPGIYPAAKANDGIQDDSGNYYKSGALPATWEVDLQSPAVIGQINLTTRLVNGSETYYAYTIEGSTDHSNWTMLTDATANKIVGFTQNAVSSPGAYRYVRIKVSSVTNIQNGNSAAWARGISEVTVYGTPPPAGVTAPSQNPPKSVSLATPVQAASTGSGTNLPPTVTVNTSDGTTRQVGVKWDLDGYTFTTPYRSYEISGTTDDGLAVSAQLETLPSTLLYYIDSGATAGSSAHSGAKSLLGNQLLNPTPDQPSSAGSWGYDASKVTGTTTTSGVTDKFANGIYGLGASGSYVSYLVPDLAPGTYTVTVGVSEWFTGPRTENLSAVPAGGAEVQLGSTKVGSTSPNPKNGIITGTITQVTRGPVTVKVTTGGTLSPVIAWLGVASGAVIVPTTDPVVDAPVADVPAGQYKTAQMVSLSSPTAGASIYYTTDGSAASRTNGTLYTGPVSISARTTLTAIAFANGTSSTAFQADYDIEPVPANGYSSVPVGKTWYDTDGNSIQAHGGGFLQKDGWYYWVGENKRHNRSILLAVSLYRSKDLLNWEFVHDLITPSTPNACSTGIFSDTSCKWERPKLVYNKSTDTYVLWAHWEKATDYAAAHLVVATSKTIDGDYQVKKNFRPGAGHVTVPGVDPTYTGTDSNWGYASRDFTVFQDPDSADAYLVSAADHSNMRIYKLSDDYTDLDWQNSYLAFTGKKREAPALVKANGRYYMIASGQSGWYPNQSLYSSTNDISNPSGWSEMKLIGNSTTFYSQPTSIITVQNTDGSRQYIYMGDHWAPKMLGNSTYVWLPLTIEGDSVSMDFHPQWRLNAQGGITYPNEELVSQGKPVTATSANSAHPATDANDGNYFNTKSSGDNDNYYQPTSVPYDWQVDLGEVKDLSRVDLSWRNYTGSEARSGYTISASADGTQWTRLVNNLTNRETGFTTHALTGEYRHIRLDVASVINDHNNASASWGAGLVEVQVYAKLPPVPPAEPTTVTIKQTGDLSMDIAWKGPQQEGGAPVTQYRVYANGSSEPLCTATAPATTCSTSGLEYGTKYEVQVTAVNEAGESSRSVASSAVTTPEVPSNDGATAVPGTPVLSTDQGWGDGLKGGSFNVLMNMWWGQNASLLKLYQDGELVSKVWLKAATPSAQTAKVPIEGLKNGSYTFEAVLVNSKGVSTSKTLTVKVTDANPAKTVLSSDNKDGDGTYTVTANLWWGTNATSYRFMENGAEVAKGELKAATPGAQSAKLDVSGKGVGLYNYTVEFTNSAGSTTSQPLTVKVFR